MSKRPTIDPNMFARTEPEAEGTEAQGSEGTRDRGHMGTQTHGHTDTRGRDTEGTEAQGGEGRYRRIVVYLPPDLAQAVDKAYLAALVEAPTGPERATRSAVVADLLRQALGL